MDTSINDTKKLLINLGLLGNDGRMQSDGKYLFYSNWMTTRFKKGLYENGLPWSNSGLSNQNKNEEFILDYPNSYMINEHGFRSNELIEGTDLVFSGCSFTFGIGLPEDAIWGSIIAKKMGLTYSNLGIPGDSVMGSITNIYQYFKEYGHPKILLCMFPDFYRTLIPENSDILISKRNYSGIISNPIRTYILNEDHPKYSKIPYYIEDVISPDVPFYYSMRYIKMLEQYCKAANIKFLWSTWSPITYSLLESQTDFSDHFVYTKSNMWGWVDQKDVAFFECDEHDYLKEQYPNCFDMSTDIEDGIYYEKKLSFHSGVHKHTHWAEEFIEKINDNSWNQ